MLHPLFRQIWHFQSARSPSFFLRFQISFFPTFLARFTQIYLSVPLDGVFLSMAPARPLPPNPSQGPRDAQRRLTSHAATARPRIRRLSHPLPDLRPKRNHLIQRQRSRRAVQDRTGADGLGLFAWLGCFFSEYTR